MPGTGNSSHFNQSWCATGVLQGDDLASFLFIILVDYLITKATDGVGTGVVTHPRLSRRHPAKQSNDLDFADDIDLLDPQGHGYRTS